MTITYVSAFLDLREDRSNDKSVDTCFGHFQTLAESGIQILVFLSKQYEHRIPQMPNLQFQYMELEDLELYKTLPKDVRLPDHRTPHHDTRNFMILMNSKLEFVKRAIDLNPFGTEHYAWIDFSICHVFKENKQTLPFLHLIGNSRLKPCLLFPGCWQANTSVSHQSVHWRFCGGFFLGDVNALTQFYQVYKENIAKIVHDTLMWEVNVWAILEQSYDWHPTWFKADHNDSIVRIPKEYIQIVASLTTSPSRMETDCRSALDSLMPQVDRIYLSVPSYYKRFQAPLQLPAYLEEAPYKEKVEVVIGEDHGPATKYLGGIGTIPRNSWVFFCDDDQEYAPNLVQRMVQTMRSVNEVYQNRYDIIQRTTSGGIIHGYVGNLANIDTLVGLPHFPLPDCAYHVDDQWMSIYYFVRSIPIVRTGIEQYSEIFKILENNHEKIGTDSLAALGTRHERVQQLANLRVTVE